MTTVMVAEVAVFTQSSTGTQSALKKVTMQRITAQQVAAFFSSRARVKLPGVAPLSSQQQVMVALQAIDSAEGILAVLREERK